MNRQIATMARLGMISAVLMALASVMEPASAAWLTPGNLLVTTYDAYDGNDSYLREYDLNGIQQNSIFMGVNANLKNMVMSYGTLYVAHRTGIKKFNPTDGTNGSFTNFGIYTDSNEIAAITVDPEGNLYATERLSAGTNKIWKIDRAGNWSVFAITTTDFSQCIAYHDGFIYTDDNVIHRYSIATGAIDVSWQLSRTYDSFVSSQSLVFDAAGNLYMGQYSHGGNLRRFAYDSAQGQVPSNSHPTKIVQDIGYVGYSTFDADGDMYIPGYYIGQVGLWKYSFDTNIKSMFINGISPFSALFLVPEPTSLSLVLMALSSGIFAVRNTCTRHSMRNKAAIKAHTRVTTQECAMNTRFCGLLCAVCFLLVLSNSYGRDGILNEIPRDSLGFAIIHNLDKASRSVDDLAKLVQSPLPDILNRVKERTGVQQGLDEQGDAAVILTNIDEQFKLVVLLPVANFDEFFTSLSSKETDGIEEVEIAGAATVVARKGGYVALASVRDRAELERFLASTDSLANDEELASWLEDSKASVVITRHGIEQLLPKLVKGIRATQDKIRQMAGENGQVAASGLDLYINLFTAAEAEVEQVEVGLRIDSSQNVDVVKRVQFKPGGAWAKWAANVEAAEGDLLAGIPADPFVVVLAGVFPSEAMDNWMKFSVDMMQDQPGFRLTPEQSEEYVKLSTEFLRDVRVMRMLVGIPAPGTGFYGNTSVFMTVEDAGRFLEDYEKTLVSMSQLAREIKSPLIPEATSERVPLDETQALKVTMNVPDMTSITPAGGVDMQAIMQHMFGGKDQLSVYWAAADEHNVLISYTSLEHLKAARDFFQSSQPGLSNNSTVAVVTTAMPVGSQFVTYISPSGVAEIATALPGIKLATIPTISDCPPIGIAAKVGPSGLEGHVFVTAETLRAVGNTIVKTRATLSDSETSSQ